MTDNSILAAQLEAKIEILEHYMEKAANRLNEQHGPLIEFAARLAEAQPSELVPTDLIEAAKEFMAAPERAAQDSIAVTWD